MTWMITTGEALPKEARYLWKRWRNAEIARDAANGIVRTPPKQKERIQALEHPAFREALGNDYRA
jgi:hypothetical protein